MNTDPGVLDLYPIAVHGTVLENVPLLTAEIDEPVNGERLLAAVLDTVSDFPLFKRKFVFQKGYQLVENPKPIEIYHVKEEERNLTFGKTTNDYPWRVFYWENTVSFEWCHAVTDGRGGAAFFSEILDRYFGGKFPMPVLLAPGMESCYDKKEPGIPQKKQATGFGRFGIPLEKDLEQAELHVIRAEMKDLMALVKRSDASPATVIPPLFSRALRTVMGKKKPVRASIVIDIRQITRNFTMRNNIITKQISYIDRFDSMPMELVSTIYRSILDLAVQKENVVKKCTEMVNIMRPLVSIKSYPLSRLVTRPAAWIAKHSECDFTLTYLGKLQFMPNVAPHIRDIRSRSWCDVGYANLCAYELNGTLFLNLVENYRDKSVVPNFIKLLNEQGVSAKETENRRIPRVRIDF